MEIPFEKVSEEYKQRLANVIEENILLSAQVKILQEQVKQLTEAPKE